jgi:hypothetical protein
MAAHTTKEQVELLLKRAPPEKNIVRGTNSFGPYKV